MPSSVVATIRYDKIKHLLTVVFVSGSVYIYKNVPEDLYAKMKQASSKGSFLNNEIKGKFEFEKIS